ncbi:MAG TPA: hypothetical protein VEA78_01055 [Acidimicrobiales bacterium]|nr:hypothetical protein [Acidimicrobiales bacterium]
MRSERGSVLALLPAAVMIVIVLGAIAVDGSLTFLAERQVANLAASVANDAATQGLDVVQYYEHGTLTLDESLVQAVADDAAAAAVASLSHLDDLVIEVDVIDASTVAVSVTARTRTLFSRAMPASVEWRSVGATARAVAQRG